MQKIGFNNSDYLALQSGNIRRRMEGADKLYLEFGGKLIGDGHAARVMPGFDPDGKIKLLSELRDSAEIILCIGAPAIAQNKVRSDVGITYDQDILRLIDALRTMDLSVSAIVITLYNGQPGADSFRQKLENRGEQVYVHALTRGYPSDVDVIVSEEGYGANPFIKTTKPLVVVTAPGPGCGKLATCLSQLYHEQKLGVKAGYAKYETFPVWNLPQNHPVNLAYEAATADLHDVNMLDTYHLDAYGVQAVNYNRDLEVFPVVRSILKRILGETPYRSPTDMGVNMIGSCITDDDIVRNAARQEVICRWYKARCEYILGQCDSAVAQRIEILMSQMELHAEDRAVVGPALMESERTGRSTVALELGDERIITGKTSELMNSTAAVVLNAVKAMAGIDDSIPLIAPTVLEPILGLKKDLLGSRYPALKLEEILQALYVSGNFNPTATCAIKQLPLLKGCEAHSSDLITRDDLTTMQKLGIRVTCEPLYPTKSLAFR
ncbi:MAG: DUF1846 domain-containing protein [Clostridia bacterium]|nr:DUF1846 domain-containing protein [Clostridia bacterium]